VETFIWVTVIVICVATVIITMLTSVTKWSNKVVDKYVKEEDITKKNSGTPKG
jgi:hypothetical protein